MHFGMNRDAGEAITDIDHIWRSVSNILMMPGSSHIQRRNYGSLLSVLIDQPQNDLIRLQVMAAVFIALSRLELRIRLNTVNITSAHDGLIVVELTGLQDDGSPVAISVSTGGE